jgi:hypothetical protein
MHHGCLRDGVEPVRHRPPPDPLALRGRLGSSFARSIAGALLGGLRSKTHPFPEISGNPYKFLCRAICPELAGATVPLRDIKRARDQRRRDLRDTLRERRKTVETLLDLRRGSLPPTTEPIAAAEDKTKPAAVLKQYRNE